jgi:hypothetical protein
LTFWKAVQTNDVRIAPVSLGLTLCRVIHLY